MEPTPQSKPRGRGRKHQKAPGHKTETAGAQYHEDSPQESPTEEPDDFRTGEQDTEKVDNPLDQWWKPTQTPPLEKSPDSARKLSYEHEMDPTNDPSHGTQEHMERRSKKPRRRKSESQEEKEEFKASETKHAITGQLAYESRISLPEEHLCTKPLDSVYTPIHLPLSCELYTPGYCVQATDRFDKAHNGNGEENEWERKNGKTQHENGKSPPMQTVDDINQSIIHTDHKKHKKKIRKGLGQKEDEIETCLPSVEISGPKFHAPDVNVGMDVGGVGEVGADVRLPKADVSVKAPKFGFKFGKKAKTPKVDVEAGMPSVEISGPKLHAPDVNVGMDVGGVGEVGADVRLPKADVSVKAPKFGFKFGKKSKAPKVEAPGLGASATAAGEADLGVDVKGEAPRGGFKLKLPKFGWPKGSLKLGGDADVSGKVKVPEASVNVSGPELGGTVELPQVPGVDASVSLPGFDAGVSGDVRPELGGDVSLTGGVEMPSAEVSVPSKKFHFGFGGKAKGDKKLKKPKVSGKADLGLDVGADIQGPEVDVHADGETKGRGWKFGWSPKISLPKVKLSPGDLSADADVKLPGASVDVSGPSITLPSVRADVDVPRVDVQLPEVSVGGDLGGAIDLGGAVPSVGVVGDVKVPDLSVSGELPSVDIGGDVGVSGTAGGLGIDMSTPRLDVDASLPSVEISGPKLHAPDVNVGMDVGGVGGVGEVGADVQLPKLDVSLKSPELGLDFEKKVELPTVDVEASLPSVEISGPKLHAPDVNVGMDNGGVADVGLKMNSVNLLSAGMVPAAVSDFAEDGNFGKSGVVVVSPDLDLIGSCAVPSSSADLPFGSSLGADMSPISAGFYSIPLGAPAGELASHIMMNQSALSDFGDVSLTGSHVFPRDLEGKSTLVSSCEKKDAEHTGFGLDIDQPVKSTRHFWSLRFPSLRRQKPSKYTGDTDVDSGIGVAETAVSTRTGSTEYVATGFRHTEDVESPSGLGVSSEGKQTLVEVKTDGHSTLPRWFRPSKMKIRRSQEKSHKLPTEVSSKQASVAGDVGTGHVAEDASECVTHRKDRKLRTVKPEGSIKKEKAKKVRKTKQPFGKRKKQKSQQVDETPRDSLKYSEEAKAIPRVPSAKSKDLLIRQTWHGNDEASQLEDSREPPELPPIPSGIHIQPILHDNLLSIDFRRRGTSDSIKRRPWSTLESPPPDCEFVDDDYLFPDALTPTKIPSFRGSKDAVYNVPYMDDKALPAEEPDWPIGESRRTLLSQLSQKSDSIIRIAAEEESSVISLDDAHDRPKEGKGKSKRLLTSSKKQTKHREKDRDAAKQKSKDSKRSQPRSKSSGRFAALFSRTHRHADS